MTEISQSQWHVPGCLQLFSFAALAAPPLARDIVRLYWRSMLHIIKLAVGMRDAAQLAAFQQAHATSRPPLRHRTRNMPKRAAEITAGGSIFWVIGGVILVRQRIVSIIRDEWDDGSPCTGLLLHPELVPLAGRPVKPFQGWRYLNAADAPADLAGGASGIQSLPEPLRAALISLALL